MPEFLAQFSAADMQVYAWVKLVGFAFVFWCILLYRFKAKLWMWAASIGLFNALAYAIFVQNTQRLFWGSQGDEVTIAAMYEMFAHGGLLRDFAYAHLPPFYPPLFFWIFAIAGKTLGMHGVLIGKMASAISVAILPLCIFIGSIFSFRAHKKDNAQVAALLTAAASIVLFSWDTILLKPYEWGVAFGVVLWSVSLMEISRRHELSWKYMLVFGIIGGVLFFTYYFWFFLAAIGISLYFLFRSSGKPFVTYAWYAGIAAVMLCIASPFLVPLVRSYHGGAENWQHGYVLLSGLATHGIPSWTTIPGLLSFLAIIGMIWYRKDMLMQQLWALFAASYVWQIMGIATIAVLASPLQESKGFYYFNTAILSVALAHAITLFLREKNSFRRVELSRVGVYVGIALLWVTGFFGTFVDDPVVLHTRIIAKSAGAGIVELAEFLRDRDKGALPVTLHGGIAELYAWTPVNSFVYFNQNNSHPAALFSERMLVVADMVHATNTAALADTARHNSFESIDRFIFPVRATSTHELWFHVDNYPLGTTEKVLRISQDLFRHPPFERVYASKFFEVYELPRE